MHVYLFVCMCVYMCVCGERWREGGVVATHCHCHCRCPSPNIAVLLSPQVSMRVLHSQEWLQCFDSSGEDSGRRSVTPGSGDGGEGHRHKRARNDIGLSAACLGLRSRAHRPFSASPSSGDVLLLLKSLAFCVGHGPPTPTIPTPHTAQHTNPLPFPPAAASASSQCVACTYCCGGSMGQAVPPVPCVTSG